MISRIFLCFVLTLIVCVAVEAVQVYNYNVTVKTADSPNFSSHKGKLKLAVFSIDQYAKSREDYVLTPYNVKLAKSHFYTASIASFASLKNMTSVYLRWTLASPYNPYYLMKKPSIYFEPIIFNSTYIDPKTHMLVTKSRKFCPLTTPVQIKHGNGSSFYPCV
ncbi:uncharacterized protein LOC107365691 [Tetranychus urticae]|uniref:Uncharacterized protein n=1 Tax=Tetranychus urticae TaxID=32264 RepID=T1KMF2_TETUR|nr:uncharacterized protein LOC107365691 [Tetranychus urticae]